MNSVTLGFILGSLATLISYLGYQNYSLSKRVEKLENRRKK